MIFAELSSGVAETFHDGCHRDVRLLPAFWCSGDADLGHTGANGNRAVDEGGAASRTALLAIVIGEKHAFFRNAVNVRRLVPHHATVVVADVLGADVITPDDEDVRFLRGLGLSRRYHCHISHQRGR